MKKIIVLLIVFTTFSVNSQDLISKISENATFVFSVNGQALFNEISEMEIENSLLFKELSYEIFRGKAMAKPSRVSDMGVKVNAKLYFAFEIQKDISFSYLTYKIADKSVFEKFLKSGDVNTDSFSQLNGLNVLTYDYDSKVVWNDDYAIFISAKYIGNEFRNSYYFDDYDYYDYEEEYPQESIYESVETIEDVVEETEMTESERIEIQKQKEEERIRKEKREAERKKKAEERKKKNEEKRQKKMIFVKGKINDRVGEFFSNEHNAQFKSLANNLFDNDAVASFYYKSFNAFGENYPTYNRYGIFNSMFGFQNYLGGNYISNLYLREEKIELTSKIIYSDLVNESFAKIYKSKINKKLISYVPHDVLGYWSFSFDTEQMLREMENVTANYFDQNDFKYNEEISLYIELVSIMLDEEEIAELVTGDALVILNDISAKTVNYESYEYDENFNSIKVTKTKQELTPEFTVMVGSEKEEIINKIFKLGVKHKILNAKNSYFLLSKKFNETPFDIYFGFKDNIFYTTSSPNQIANMINGKATSKLASKHKKHIKSNTSSTFIDFKGIVDRMMLNENLTKDMGMLFDIKDDLTDFYSTSNYKNNEIQINSVITIPDGEKSSAHYLLNIIDKGISYNDK